MKERAPPARPQAQYKQLSVLIESLTGPGLVSLGISWEKPLALVLTSKSLLQEGTNYT